MKIPNNAFSLHSPKKQFKKKPADSKYNPFILKFGFFANIVNRLKWHIRGFKTKHIEAN